MKRLFGTDGIRGRAGEAPLDAVTVRRVGLALGELLAEEVHHPPRVALAMDTRESGPWLRDALAAGLAASGASAVDAGVLPTPGLAHVTRAHGFDAGVMISASHNPFEDNGLKVFRSDGLKLADALEAKIETHVLDGDHHPTPEAGAAPPVEAELGLDYVARMTSLLEGDRPLHGLELYLDCAHGAAAEIAPEIFTAYGARVECRGVSPDGRNINLDCGSLHLDGLAEAVRASGSDLGLAFDGDADRVLAVDRNGRVVDGDFILYVCGCDLKRRGRLAGDRVVATIMSNLWLERALEERGIALSRAPVGDKYVRERMEAEGSVLGGEQSGHVIFLEQATTGDGILTGLMLLDALRASSEPLEALLDRITPCPQLLINVRVREKPDLRDHPVIGSSVVEIERRLGDRGRVVLRYSGTEPLARVMVEGFDEREVERSAQELAATIRTQIGA